MQKLVQSPRWWLYCTGKIMHYWLKMQVFKIKKNLIIVGSKRKKILLFSRLVNTEQGENARHVTTRSFIFNRGACTFFSSLRFSLLFTFCKILWLLLLFSINTVVVKITIQIKWMACLHVFSVFYPLLGNFTPFLLLLLLLNVLAKILYKCFATSLHLNKLETKIVLNVFLLLFNLCVRMRVCVKAHEKMHAPLLNMLN